MPAVAVFPVAVLFMWLAGAIGFCLGWVFCPIAYVLGATRIRPSQIYLKTDAGAPMPALLAWRWKWLSRWWGNEEDGIDGGAWYAAYLTAQGIDLKTYPQWKRVLGWSCWRNSFNNFRFYGPLAFNVIPGMLVLKGAADPLAASASGFAWRWMAQGWYGSLAVAYKGNGVWLGWKFEPWMVTDFYPEHSTRGVAFATNRL